MRPRGGLRADTSLLPLLMGIAVVALSLIASVRARADEPRVTKLPSLRTFVEAEYPPERKAAGTTASVLLSIEIGADGQVARVAVLASGGADFDAAAVAAAQRFVFTPAEVDGKPAPVKITYKYDFVVKEEVVPVGPQVNFEGVVLDRFSKKPLAGVRIALTDLGRDTTTDEAGHFALVDVPLGAHTVELSGPSLVTLSTEEQIAAKTRKAVRYLVERKARVVDEEEVVRAPRLRKESVETVIRTEEARRVPGTQGDTLKVVQNLPGVARASFGSGQLIVWGSSPRDTRVDVDGVEIPALYHVGGLRSTLNSEWVKSIELLPGGYGADHGRGLGGLVRVKTATPQTEGVHGFVAVDVLDASAGLTAAVGKRLTLAVAGRYSYLDKLLEGILSPDVGDYFPIPRYDDYQLKATLRLRENEQLSLTFLGSDDHLRRTLPSQDPAQTRSEVTDSSFYRLFLRYTRLAGDGASVEITPSIGFDLSKQHAAFGAISTRLDNDSFRYGLRAAYRRKLARPFTLTVGLDLAGQRAQVSRFGSLSLPAREGDKFVFGQPPGDDVHAEDFTAHILNAGLYVTGELTLGPVKISPGLRLDAFLLEGNHLLPPEEKAPPFGYQRLDGAIDPRLAISVRAHARVSLDAAVGVYHQAPEPEELSAVFGNPKLGLSRAVHVTAGLTARLTGTLTAQAVGFYKYLDALVSRSPLPSPEVARALVQDGEGRSYGGQFLLRQELWRGLFGWISYTVGRSERQDHPTTRLRLFDYDQTHVLAVVASYEFRGWAFGARFRLSTGFPRTPVLGAYYDARIDAYQPLFGRQNAIRLPNFYQLDLRVEKTFVWPRASFHVFLDVQNVTYQQNPEEIVYRQDFTRPGYITGLPTLAVLGAKVQW